MHGPIATASSIVAILFPLHVLAQANPPDTASGPDSLRTIPVDPVVVTVSKVPLRLGRAGFSVSVLPAGTLEEEHPVYAAEALRELPGAFIDEAVGPGGPTIIRLRGGEEVFTQILMDGVQVNEAGGFFDFQGVTLSNLERIEVARGPQSALHGSSAVSGVVQFVTRSGQAGPPRVGGTLEGGGDAGDGRRFRAAVEVDGGTPSLLYSAGLGTAYNRGIYDLPHDTWTKDGSLRLDAQPSEDWRLTGIARYVGVDSKHPVRDAGVTRVPLDPNAELERNRLVLTGIARHEASARWAHRVRGSLFRQHFVFSDERDDIELPDGVFITDADFDFGADLWRGTGEYVGSWSSADDPADGRLAVAFGVQGEREVLDQSLTGDFGDSEDRFDRNSLAGFADLHGSPHARLALLAGARVEKFEGIEAELTPRASATFEALPGRLSLRGAVGRAYKAPNLMEQYTDNGFLAANPDLKPETSVSWEGGVDLTAGALSVSATAFRQSYRNLIRTVPMEDGERFQNRNVGTSRAWGVESRADYRIRPDIVAGATFTRTWTEVEDNTGLSPDLYPEGEELPFRPTVTASGWVRTRPHERVEVMARASRVGSQIVLSERFGGRRVEIDGYYRVDGTLDVLLGEGRTAYLRIDNMLDTTYETAFDRTGIPLTLVAGLRVR